MQMKKILNAALSIGAFALIAGCAVDADGEPDTTVVTPGKTDTTVVTPPASPDVVVTPPTGTTTTTTG